MNFKYKESNQKIINPQITFVFDMLENSFTKTLISTLVVKRGQTNYEEFQIFRLQFFDDIKSEQEEKIEEDICLSESSKHLSPKRIFRTNYSDVDISMLDSNEKGSRILGSLQFQDDGNPLRVPYDKYSFSYSYKKNQSISKYNEQRKQEEYRRGPYRVYSEDLKFQALQMMETGENEKEVAKKLLIPLKNLKRWSLTGGIRKKGGGRKQMDRNMEKKLYNWIINEMMTTGKKVSRMQIRDQALYFTKHKGKFKASKGWTDKFVRKYNLKVAEMKKRIEQRFEEKQEYIIETSDAISSCSSSSQSQSKKIKVAKPLKQENQDWNCDSFFKE